MRLLQLSCDLQTLNLALIYCHTDLNSVHINILCLSQVIFQYFLLKDQFPVPVRVNYDGTKSINNSCFPELRRSNGHPTTNPKDPLPSPYYRKGKRWKDIHPTKSLWNNGQPQYLPGIWEGTWFKLFVCESDLTADQVTLDPSMDVSDSSTFLKLPLNMKLARRAQHWRPTHVLQSWGLRFSWLPRNRVRWHRGTRDFAGIHSTQMWRKATAR